VAGVATAPPTLREWCSRDAAHPILHYATRVDAVRYQWVRIVALKPMVISITADQVGVSARGSQ